MSETGITPERAPAEAASAAPGARLARAREMQGLSVADVARQLKLSVAQVEALEAGQFDRLPGPVFVRGFIRNYARLVKLDPEELLQAAGESLPQQARRPETPPSQDIPFPTAESRNWPKYAIATAVLVAGLAFYEFYLNEPETVVTRSVAVAPAPVSAAREPQEATASPVPAGTQSETATARTGADASQPAVSAAAPARNDAAPSSSRAARGESEKPARPGERQLRLVFEDESWVEIRDRDGNTIFSQLNRPGTRRLINGLPPLSLVVGNAQGVRITYDDRPVDLARHTKVDVARLTLE